MTSEGHLEAHRMWGGEVPCPACKDTTARGPLEAGSCVGAADIARLLGSAIFDKYEAAKWDAKENELWKRHQLEFDEKLRKLKRNFESQQAVALEEENTKATEEHMRRQYPNAVQCPQCHAGPVLPEGCSNLQTHKGQGLQRGFISNACPNCGFFARDRSEWARWDGKLR